MRVLDLRGQHLRWRARNVVASIARIVHVLVLRECVRGTQRDVITDIAVHEHRAWYLIGQAKLDAAVPGLRRVAIGGNRKRRSRKRLHVDVENLVSQLDVIGRDVPVQTEPASAATELILPRALSSELN